MTFLMSLPVVLSRTIGQKDLGVLYKSLFSLEMMTVLADLKLEDQCSKLMQVSVIFISFSKQ